MKKRIIIALTGLVVSSLVLVLFGKFSTVRALEFPRVSNSLTRKIVVFKPEIGNEPAREALVQKFGGVKIKDLSLINGKAVLLPPAAVEILRRQAGVLRIDDDVVVEALADRPVFSRWARPTPTPTTPPVQVLPWGVDRIDADLAWTVSSGSGVKVAVVDTGIQTTHPDLQANIKGGVSTVSYTRSYNDDNGHGTHVAGIVAALNNTFGVVGVGPKINLYSVKVLDRWGNGYLSDVIEGLDWAITNGMQVVNMSLGTSSNVLSFQEAVQRVNTAGIVQVAAAGNSGGTVIFPAAYPQVIAVSAIDKNDVIASWSSRGSEVDLAAPGVDIYSTYKGSTYQKLSGTSMASPHVAGAAALVLTLPSKCEYLLDLIPGCSSAEVQKRLETTAEDLGVAGKDKLYGSGLVDVEKAVIQ